MAELEISPQEALERFIVENDDLQALEEAVGRFNIFDALRVARVEIRHSNFLAWLLDPLESHGQGDVFLKALLMDLLRECPRDLRPLSPVDLDGVELVGVEVAREYQGIDFLIACRQPALVVAVENKVGSGEHGDQLARYEKVVEDAYPGRRPLRVFLTVDGDEPSREGWVPYTYEALHRALDRCRRSNASAIGGDVLVAVDHYLRLLGSRFMNDPKIDELCQRIYRNHRQALDLIFERVMSSASELLRRIVEDLTQASGGWEVIGTTSRRVAFVPKAWKEMLPPIGARKTFDPRLWLVWELHVRDDKCMFWLVVWPTTDPAVRQRVIERLVRDRQEFGLRIFFKDGAGYKWTRLCNEPVKKWPAEEEPDPEEILTAVRGKLAEVSRRFVSLPAAVELALAAGR